MNFDPKTKKIVKSCNVHIHEFAQYKYDYPNEKRKDNSHQRDKSHDRIISVLKLLNHPRAMDDIAYHIPI